MNDNVQNDSTAVVDSNSSKQKKLSKRQIIIIIFSSIAIILIALTIILIVMFHYRSITSYIKEDSNTLENIKLEDVRYYDKEKKDYISVEKELDKNQFDNFYKELSEIKVQPYYIAQKVTTTYKITLEYESISYYISGFDIGNGNKGYYYNVVSGSLSNLITKYITA